MADFTEQPQTQSVIVQLKTLEMQEAEKQTKLLESISNKLGILVFLAIMSALFSILAALF